VAGLRAIGIQGISFDLIYGLPHQTVRSCVETVEQCAALRPGRFAVFGYAHLPSFKKHQQKIDESALPDGVARQEQAEAIAERLGAAGYERIGIDHFALPEDGLALAAAKGALHRNFQGYTTDPCETLIGFGASAISRLPQGYLQNEVVLGHHAERVLAGELPIARGYRLTPDDRLRAELIERLMCDLEVDVAAICARHRAEPTALLRSAERLRALAADGIIQLDGNVIRLAKDRRALARTVAAAFDAYLASTGRTFSRAV
jgi:oxygen-independent coproporphyrinogen-3 oxidase